MCVHLASYIHVPYPGQPDRSAPHTHKRRGPPACAEFLGGAEIYMSSYAAIRILFYQIFCAEIWISVILIRSSTQNKLLALRNDLDENWDFWFKEYIYSDDFDPGNLIFFICIVFLII